jgi:type IV pilus assembly protein PilP
MKYPIFVIGMGVFLLMSCSKSDEFLEIDAALEKAGFIQTVKIEPLPGFPHQSDYQYQSTTQRNPFQANNRSFDIRVSRKIEVAEPDLMRVKEPLEFFSLSSLRLVGSLGNPGELWGLVKEPLGMVSKVTVGDRIGTDFGEIVKVNKGELVVVEKISNGKGVWFSQSRSILVKE